MKWASIPSFFKILRFAKRKLEKKYTIYKALKSLGILSDKEGFTSVYMQALEDFEELGKHPILIKLFALRTAIDAYQNDFINNTSDKFFNDLDVNLHTGAKFAEIQNASIDLKKEINEFNICFSTRVNESQLPKEKVVNTKIERVDENVAFVKQYLLNNNTYLPKELKRITELRSANEYKAVLNLLEKFKEKEWDNLSDELKYSVTINFGATYFEIGDKKKAAEYFVKLLDFNYKVEEALGYAALGYALLNISDKSIEYAYQAIDKDKNNTKAYLALFFSKQEILDVEEIDNLIPKHIQEKPEIAINIATFLQGKKQYDKAFEILERINQEYPEMDSFKCDILVQLANNKIFSIKNTEDFYYKQLDESSIDNLKYARDKFIIVWDYIKDTELRKSRWYVLTNRGITYKMLGENESAEKDFLASLEIDKNYLTYHQLLLLKIDNPAEFNEILNQIEKISLTGDEFQEFTIYKAEYLFKISKTDEAFELLLGQFKNATSSSIRNPYLLTLIEKYLTFNNIQEAEKLALIFIEENPEDPFSFYNLSRIAFKKNDKEQAIIYLQRSKSFIKKGAPRYTVVLIADKFIDIKDFKSAAECLEKISNFEVLSPITKKLIDCFYNAGNYKKAMEISQKLFLKNKTNSFLVDVISSIYEINDQYDESIETISSYLSHFPDEKLMLVKLSINYCKKGDLINGIKVLDSIKDYSELPINIQFLIAHAYIKNGDFAKGMEIAYNLRNENLSDPIIHTKYIQCITFTNNSKNEDIFPSVIKSNCYIKLKDKNNKIIEFIIVDNPKYEKEISIDEPLSQKLIDKLINGEIELNGETLRIESIICKYTYALHDSMTQLGMRFGNSQPIKVFTIKEGDNPKEQFKELFARIDMADDFDKKITELYLQGNSTIGVNSSMMNVNPIKYWGKLISQWDVGVNSIGTKLEFQIGLQLLASDKALILDIVTLLTLFHIEGFELLSFTKSKRYVTKSTIEIIKDEISDMGDRINDELMIVNKVGEEYVKYIVTPEEKRKKVENLETLLNLINKYCEIINPSISENYFDKKDKDKLLGKAFNESMLAAKENDLLIFSDDLFYRNICFNEHKLNGISSFNFIMFLNTQELLENGTTEAFLEKMIKLNYRNIPSNPKMLFNIFKESGSSINQPFVNACDFINVNFIPDDIEASKFLVGFLFELYTSGFMPINKDSVIQFILTKLFNGRNSLDIKRFLISLIDTKFYLLPLYKEEIIKIVKSF